MPKSGEDLVLAFIGADIVYLFFTIILLVFFNGVSPVLSGGTGFLERLAEIWLFIGALLGLGTFATFMDMFRSVGFR